MVVTTAPQERSIRKQMVRIPTVMEFATQQIDLDGDGIPMSVTWIRQADSTVTQTFSTTVANSRAMTAMETVFLTSARSLQMTVTVT